MISYLTKTKIYITQFHFSTTMNPEINQSASRIYPENSYPATVQCFNLNKFNIRCN